MVPVQRHQCAVQCVHAMETVDESEHIRTSSPSFQPSHLLPRPLKSVVQYVERCWQGRLQEVGEASRHVGEGARQCAWVAR